MSNTLPPAPSGPAAPYGPTHPTPEGYGTSGQPVPAAKGGKNVLGLVAMGIAIVGFIFACVPGALIIGWILLPIAFILGIVAIFMKGAKWAAITAIIVSVVGTVVGVIVFFAVVATSFNSAFSNGETKIGDAVTSEQQSVEAEETAEDSAAVGTRENPVPLGTEVSNDEWKVTVNSVTQGAPAADAVAGANSFNDTADAGSEYIIINYTVTYIGDDADGQMPAFVGLDYVTAGGVTVNSTEKLVVAPDALDSLSTLYNGGTATGNTALQVPSPVDGVLVVRPGMFGDKVFVALQ